jgi:hypothetical protein
MRRLWKIRKGKYKSGQSIINQQQNQAVPDYKKRALALHQTTWSATEMSSSPN